MNLAFLFLLAAAPVRAGDCPMWTDELGVMHHDGSCPPSNQANQEARALQVNQVQNNRRGQNEGNRLAAGGGFGLLGVDMNSRGARWLLGEGANAQQFINMPPEKRWPFLHRRLERRVEELSRDEDPNIRQIASNIHQQIDKVANEKLGDGWESPVEPGKEPAKFDPEAVQLLIKSAMGVRDVMDGANLIQDLKRRADTEGPSMPKAEFDRLVAQANEAQRKMDECMAHALPAEIHGPLMGEQTHPLNITKPLANIGYVMNGHIEWMQQTMPSPGVHTGAAQYHAGNRDWSSAESAASQALAMDPQNGTALTVRAQSRFEQGNYAGALQDAQSALRVNPGNEAARGISQFAQGRLGDAMEAPKTSNPFGGMDHSAHLAGNTAGPAGAMASREARESQQWTNDAKRYLQLRDMDQARRALDRALEVNPANADAHALRAMVAAGQGRMTDAMGDVRSILRLDPNHAKSVVNKMAFELNKRGRYSDAKGLLELLSPGERDAAAWFNLAAAENGLGNRDAMMAALKMAAQMDAANYGAKFERALAAGPGEDLGFLFDQQPAKDTNNAQVPKETSRKDRLLYTIIAMLSGAILLALGLNSSKAGQRWTTKVRGAFSPDEAAMEAVGVEAPPLPEAGPNVVGNIELLRQIGLGGMGIVYEGLDRTLGRRVAVKKMREEIRVDPRERERFMSEARTVAKLRHPGIVEIHSIVEKGDDVYLVFEYVDGSTVYETLDRRGRLPLKEALKVAQMVGDALTYAHSRDIIHRDLKPSNVMIAENGTVKVMDFGVARQAKDAVSKLSMTNTIVGTPPYMAPEQEQGMVCKESDVYALGVCFYELVTGRLPFQGTGAGMLLNKMNKTYAPATSLAPDLPAALDAFFAKAFEPEPTRRFRNVPDLLEALKTAAVAK